MTEHMHYDNARQRGSPTASAMVLLAIYVAMYLAVAAVVGALDPQDEHAVAPADMPARVARSSTDVDGTHARYAQDRMPRFYTPPSAFAPGSREALCTSD